MRLAFAILLASCSACFAATVATDGSRADFASKAATLSDGDTITIPSGSFYWGASVTVTKAVTVQGAGTNLTTLNLTDPTAGFLTLKPGSDKPTRVTGITFSCTNWPANGPGLVVMVGNCKMFRVDRCAFLKGSLNLFYNPGGAGASGPAYGVIDHNTFFDCNSANRTYDVESGEFDWGSNAWRSAYSILPGTTNAVVIEDNLFVTDDQIGNPLNNNNQMLYGWAGCRATFRHNTFISSGSDDALAIDAHGAYSAAEGIRGTLMFEVYSNLFEVNVGFGYFFLRGGIHLWFGNTCFLTNGTQGTLIQIADERNPPRDYITNSYFWNNTLNGSAWTGPLALRGGFPSTSIVFNQSYFMDAPQSGQTFFPYTPLVYPHPLVTAQDGTGAGSPSVVSVGSAVIGNLNAK